MSAVSSYNSNIVQNGPLGIVYVPVGLKTYGKIRLLVFGEYAPACFKDFKVPPFFDHRPGSPAVGAHVSIISEAEARTYNVNLGREDYKEVTLKFGDFRHVQPINWRGYRDIIVLELTNPEEFAQIRQKYGLPPNPFPFSLTVAVMSSGIPPQIKNVIPITEAPKYSAKLIEIMKRNYDGRIAQTYSGFIHIALDQSFYSDWRMIPEAKNYSFPPFWGTNGVGIHSTVATGSETKEKAIYLNNDWNDRTVKFTITDIEEITPVNWMPIRKALILKIYCPMIDVFRQVHELLPGFPPHITIGVIYKSSPNNLTSCHTPGLTPWLPKCMSFPSRSTDYVCYDSFSDDSSFSSDSDDNF